MARKPGMRDPTYWWRNHYKGDDEMVTSVIPHLQSLFGRLGDLSLTAEAAEFWKRAVLEAVTARVVAGMPSERDGPLPSALKIVRQVEEYLDARPNEPIHISEICSHLHVPRRTLHRAFHEALGTGPIAFLRHRRLCAAHTALRASEDIRTISDIAMQFGFQNLGRFAGYYHQLFGEYPSETRQRHRPQLDLPNGKSARYPVQPRAHQVARMRMLVQPSLRAQRHPGPRHNTVPDDRGAVIGRAFARSIAHPGCKERQNGGE